VLYQAAGPLTADALIDAANALRRRPGPSAARG